MSGMSLTDAQRSVLVSLSDQEWRMGHDLTKSGIVLAALNRRGLIRHAEFYSYLDAIWTITPDGLAALEASQ